ncbi:MAG: hypothetical protein JXA89_12285 [Anaerolineae bacterium]|nr:hypothetical protein [Anaerolineae bacterium]
MTAHEKETGIIYAETEVGVPVAQARQWFLSLKTEPQRYRFATHEGVTFVSGDFGKAGARFYTRERFLGLKLTLQFELIAVNDAGDRAAFRFKLLKPLGGRIWGEFAVVAMGSGAVLLSLSVGAATQLGSMFLRFYPVTAAVRGQIQREVAHIKASMEQIYT